MVNFSYNSYNLTISYNSYLAYEVVFLHHLRNSTGPKGTPLEYFRLCETFFRKKFTKGPPFNFLIFSNRMDVEKSQRVPLSVFFGIVRLFSILFHKRVPNSPILWHFEVLLLFLSLRYGAVPGLFLLRNVPSLLRWYSNFISQTRTRHFHEWGNCAGKKPVLTFFEHFWYFFGFFAKTRSKKIPNKNGYSVLNSIIFSHNAQRSWWWKLLPFMGKRKLWSAHQIFT